MTDSANWRDDPRWKLVTYDPEAYPDGKPADRPSDDAELAQPVAWCSRYVGRKLVATWAR
jgi:hypothetical protein